MHEFFDDIAPLPTGLGADDEIHQRCYIVRAYRKNATTLLLRGAVRDQKPPGLYIPGDPEPLTVHHMIVDLDIEIPSLVILAADVKLAVHPEPGCPSIEAHYQNLVGLTIARGFTHRVRELFGGPRGCTHTTALLQAMAPVALQSIWSFAAVETRATGGPFGSGRTPEDRMRGIARNLNTCHVWDEHGPAVARIREGGPHEVPLWIKKRAAELGIPAVMPD